MNKRACWLLASTWFVLAIGWCQQLKYQPGEGGFVCVDGGNRFSRALYGGHSSYRLETSDRPVFALFQDSRHCRNVSFRLAVDGKDIALDSTRHCRAVYAEGTRRYEVTDDEWKGSLRMTAWCLYDHDAALWRIEASNFDAACKLQLIVTSTGIRAERLNRNGDIGVDDDDCFESNGQVYQQFEVPLSPTSPVTYIIADTLTLRPLDIQTAETLLQPTLTMNHELATRIVFDTPDDLLNPVGCALCLAADGVWDGETWLHGAVGWRTQLAGWRAAYLGDVLGWSERARSHFDAYAHSMVTDVPPQFAHPTQDPQQNMARSLKKWGTQMYSNGYICRRPGHNDEMHHYDMNLNYVDELLWHFQFEADTAELRRYWPLLTRHLEWEKRNFDSDGDGLYDAYCCIWASDALYYSGGAVTHSSAYNYRANRLAARIAQIIGEDPTPYQEAARKTLAAMNNTLWLPKKGHWAEYKDKMGLQRVHESAAVWSIYTPIDSGARTPQQAWQASQYIEREIPHIPILTSTSQETHMLQEHPNYTISTSNWHPYEWSINNVAAAEVMHTALACFEAGNTREGFSLLKGNIVDLMYSGRSPGNFGQISQHDAARGECYRDFGDCTGIAARALLQGLFGIVPQALDGLCYIRPGFPEEWEHASIQTPYLSYDFHRENGQDIYTVHQHFAHPLRLVLRQNLANGETYDYVGNLDSIQVFRFPHVKHQAKEPTSNPRHSEESEWISESENSSLVYTEKRQSRAGKGCRIVSLSPFFNASVTDIFRNEYRSPRPSVTTLQIPLQGVGDWCHPTWTPDINDSLFRSRFAQQDTAILDGIPFRSTVTGPNIIFTSLWDNYPDSVTLPLKGHAAMAHLLMAGSTNHMQSRIDNALVIVRYKDGTTDTLRLRNPDNWCPIERDYYIDDYAFHSSSAPIRVCLNLPYMGRDIGTQLGLKGADGRIIPGGAAQIITMPLNPHKKLRSLTLRTLSNDIVAGIMAITLE